MNPCYQCSSLTSDEAVSEAFKGFGLCGKCRIDRKRSLGSDGSLCKFGASSKAAQIHREQFVYYRLQAAAADTYAISHEAQYGFRPMAVWEYGRKAVEVA